MYFPPEATVFDPWFGSGGTSHYLRDLGLQNVLGSDILPRDGAPAFAGDALLPATYDNARRHFRRPIDIILTSPWFALLDLAAPLAYQQADFAAIIHIPFYYLTQGHELRSAWLADLTEQKLAYTIRCDDRGNTGFRCLWLVLFKTKEAREVMCPSLPELQILPPTILPPSKGRHKLNDYPLSTPLPTLPVRIPGKNISDTIEEWQTQLPAIGWLGLPQAAPIK
jgi:hypothetical protein